MRGHLKYALTADMSPDEKKLVTGGADKALELWEVTSGRLLGQMQSHTSDIETVAFTPNGRLIISASEDRSVRIWSLDHQQELAMLAFQKEGDECAGIAFDNRTFGDRNFGLLSVYVNGKQYRGRRPNTSSNILGAALRSPKKKSDLAALSRFSAHSPS